MVREVWETQYRRLRGEPSVMTGNSAAKRQRKYYNPFQAYCERTRSVSGSAAVKDELADADRFDGEDDEDELELWQSSWEDGDGDVRDPLSHWHERRRRYLRLSRMALDFLTIQAISAEIASHYFVLAEFFSWLLLAGLIVSPSTFASVSYISVLVKAVGLGSYLATTVRSIPLLCIASFSCLVAVTGLGWLWWKWKHNYIWVNRYIVM